MRRLSFEQILISGFGCVFVALGLFYVISPLSLLTQAGEFSLDASAVTDIRATYGGVHLAVGIYCVSVARDRTSVSHALLLLGLIGVAVGVTRLLFSQIDTQVLTLHGIAGGLEAIAGAVLLWLWRRHTHTGVPTL